MLIYGNQNMETEVRKWEEKPPIALQKMVGGFNHWVVTLVAGDSGSWEVYFKIRG